MSECLDQALQPIVPPVEPGSDPISCDCDSINAAIAAKQDRLIAGSGITISGSVISATGGGGGGTAGVTAFNGRSGAVSPQAGDYSASLIRAGDGKTVQQYIDTYNSNQPESAMSNTSTKAVQNKVIKAYVDAVDRKTLPAGGTTGAVLTKVDNSNYNTRWTPITDFMMKSQYDTNNNGKVDKAENADALVYGSYKVTAPAINQNTVALTALDKGAANGVAPLDSNSKVPLENLPSVFQQEQIFGGVFNASTRVASLTAEAKAHLGVTTDTLTMQNVPAGSSGYQQNQGIYYQVSDAGTFAGMNLVPGDYLVSTGNKWDRLNGGIAGVTSVNNKTGVVNLRSDDVPQGSVNLYMTTAEKSKLAGIENQATRDVNVIQTATVTQLADGTKVLRLTNKNGTVTTFEGNSAEGDFLTKTGNATNTYITYSPTGRRDAFVSGETTGLFARKVVDWLQSLETVAFTGEWNDIKNRPTRLSQFINDGDGTNPFVTRTTTNLLNYYLKDQTYTKREVEDLLEAIDRMNFIVVDALPSSGIQTNAIYYVPQAAPATGYNRYQYIQGRWVHLGTTDISPDNYLEKDGNASNTYTSLGTYDSRQLLQADETLREHFGKINKWLADLKDIAFTADWHDLTNANELATQDDLENYVVRQWNLADAGKALVVGNDGLVTTQSIGDTVVRKGTGFRSVVGNDHPDAPLNDARGEYSSAFGFGTVANADYQSVRGEFNEIDSAGSYLDIVGNGTDAANRSNAYTLNKDGDGWFKGAVRVGNTSDNVITPTVPNDLTTKKYVDELFATSGNLKKQVVTRIPSVASASENVIYLLEDPNDPDVYQQWMKILIGTNPDVYDMVQVGSTETDLDDYQLKEPGDLNTTSPSVSGAINELLAMIGDLSDLDTSVKTDVVSAINSLSQTGEVIYRVVETGENVKDYADGTKGAYVLSVPAGINGNPSTTASSIVSIPTNDKNNYYQFAMSGNVDVYFRRQPKAYAAEMPWKQMAVESIQQATMPTPDTSLEGKVYQYTGTTNAQYKTGVWYRCEHWNYYAWVEQQTANTFFTTNSAPAQYSMIYSSTFAETTNLVDSVSGIIMTDTDGDQYTRVAALDTDAYIWVPLMSKTSDLKNNGNGTGQPSDYFVTRGNALSQGTDISSVTTSTKLSKVNPETGEVKDVTVQKLWDFIWKKIYPIGSVYTTITTDSPATLFGGTWVHFGQNRVLWGAKEGDAAGSTLAEQLPNIYGNVDFTGGAQGHPEVTYESGALRKSDYGNLTYPQPSGLSSAYHGIVLDASKYNSVYTSNGIVRPNAYTVHFWRRTA